jgi:hypothetical protein
MSPVSHIFGTVANGSYVTKLGRKYGQAQLKFVKRYLLIIHTLQVIRQYDTLTNCGTVMRFVSTNTSHDNVIVVWTCSF